MAKSQTFDVTRNISGLAGITNINGTSAEIPEKISEPRKEIKKEEDKTVTPVKDVKASSNEEFTEVGGLKLPIKKKETKTMHKNFLMTEKYYNAFKKLAEERGQSENALFNDILFQLFGEI